MDAPMHLANGGATRPLMESAAAGEHSVHLVTLEASFGWPPGQWVTLSSSAPDSWTLVRESVLAETHGSMVSPASYTGLKALFADYSPLAMAQLSPEDRLRDFDTRNPSSAAMPPPRPLLRQVVEDQITRLDTAAASVTLARLADAYGESRDTEALRGQLEATRPDELEGPTLDVLLSTPIASAGAAQPLLGEWRGYTVMEGASMSRLLGYHRRDVTLTKPVDRNGWRSMSVTRSRKPIRSA